MASVWYIGKADSRTITAAQWAAAGVAGASDTTWNASNGWSLPASGFTAGQLVILNADGAFNTAAPDGPRSSSVVQSNDTKPLTLNDLKAMGLYPKEELSGTLVARAANETMVATSFSGGAPVLVPYCAINVPPSIRAVEISWQCALGLTSMGAGNNGFLCTNVYELPSGGGATLLETFMTPVQASQPATVGISHRGDFYVPPSDVERNYSLYVLGNKNGGSSYPVGTVTNYLGQQSSWIEARLV